MVKPVNIIEFKSAVRELEKKKRLSDEQIRFFAILEQFPRIAGYWDIEKLELNINMLKNDLGVLSSGEAAMARFLAGVWIGNNIFDFDLFEHGRDFDRKCEKVLQEWVTDPFYP